MFVGHYGVSFAAKSADRSIPLWVLFVAVQLLDDHLRHCVSDAVQSDDRAESDRIITEASRAIERLVRS